MRPASVSYSVVITYHFPIERHKNNNNNNILYSSQRKIKAVVQSYTLTYNEELNCTYLNNSKSHDQLLFEYFSLSCNITTSFCFEFDGGCFALSYRVSYGQILFRIQCWKLFTFLQNII